MARPFSPHYPATFWGSISAIQRQRRVMRLTKEEIIWLNEFAPCEEAKEKIGRWIQEDDNKLYVQSKLGYMSPEEFEAKLEEEWIRKAA
jgi:hypothetical protein